MGLHASGTASITLDDVFVPDGGLLGEVGDGFKVAMSALDGGRYSVAAGCVGICQGCVDESERYAREREQFGRPSAGFQLVQAMLAEMRVRTDAARRLVWRADARVTTLYEGTSQIRQLIIGRALTGIDALLPTSDGRPHDRRPPSV